jgi:lipoyl(octanoyl) transferase
MGRDQSIKIEQLGRADYIPIWKAMQGFTAERTESALDELWVVEHPPVFTIGLNGKAEHLLDPGTIPVVQCDRGGQVTYHAPGQVVIYLLLDLKRLGTRPRALVSAIENAAIGFLAQHGVHAEARAKAPGVYVGGRKIAALGLRIKRGCSYHGLAFNVDMDLSPFKRINPCGYPGLETTRLKDHVASAACRATAQGLCRQLVDRLGYNEVDSDFANEGLIDVTA